MKHYSQAAVERAMKVQEIILRAIAKRITWLQAAQIIGISPRQMRRWMRRYEQFGYDGLFDRRRGKPSPKRIPLETLEQVLMLYQQHYFDFNVKHFHEKLVEDHQIQLSYTFVKTALQEAGLVKKCRKRAVHRKRRPRRPLPGMMLHIDASKHRWFQDSRFYDLIVILDDATSEIYYAQLVEEESTFTVMRALREVVEAKGVFCSLYSDRASHFFVNAKAGERLDKDRLTQVGRAMKELGVEMIAAYSPQARGRSERGFGTWQGRLPQELRLRAITTMEVANEFLRTSYIKEFNSKFTVPAQQPGTAFVGVKARSLELIFCLQHDRVVAKDNTVSLDRRIFQIEKSKWRTTLAGCRVTIYEHQDQTVSIRYGPHEVGKYTALGEPLMADEAKQKKTKRKGTHRGFNSAAHSGTGCGYQ
jgi:transposase